MRSLFFLDACRAKIKQVLNSTFYHSYSYKLFDRDARSKSLTPLFVETSILIEWGADKRNFSLHGLTLKIRYSKIFCHVQIVESKWRWIFFEDFNEKEHYWQVDREGLGLVFRMYGRGKNVRARCKISQGKKRLVLFLFCRILIEFRRNLHHTLRTFLFQK